MLTPQIPTLLALLGTVLMAIVIFAPVPLADPVSRHAPPSAPVGAARLDEDVSPADERYSPLPFGALMRIDDELSMPDAPVRPAWPALIDPCAADCDAAARTALIDALTSVGGAWAEAIVRRALDEETDAGVRAAILTAVAWRSG